MGRVQTYPRPVKPRKPSFFNMSPITTGAWSVANQFRGSFVEITVPVLVNRARIRIATQSGNISVAIYNMFGTQRLATSGALACPAVGNADIVIPETLLLPSTYFVGVSADNITAGFVVDNSAHIKGAALTAGAHPAPAAVTVDDSSAGSAPVIGLWHT